MNQDRRECPPPSAAAESEAEIETATATEAGTGAETETETWAGGQLAESDAQTDAFMNVHTTYRFLHGLGGSGRRHDVRYVICKSPLNGDDL